MSSLPYPPSLTCDNKKKPKCRVYDTNDAKLKSVLRRPRDLPGEGKPSLAMASFYPYDESSSEDIRQRSPTQYFSDLHYFDDSHSPTKGDMHLDKKHSNSISGSHYPETPMDNESRNSMSDSQSPSHDPETPMNSDSGTPISPRKRMMSYDEKYFIEKGFRLLRTFVLHTEGDKNKEYICQLETYYGDIFLLSYGNEEARLGDETVSLFEKEIPEMLLVSEPFTKVVFGFPSVATLFKNGLHYKSKTYIHSNTISPKKLETSFPSSYPIFPRSAAEDIHNISVKVRHEATKIENAYRQEVTRNVNSISDQIKEIATTVNSHFDTFGEIDKNLVLQSNHYYDHFSNGIRKGNLVPSKEDTHRIAFISEATTRYISAYFILLNNMQTALSKAKQNFEENVPHFYLQVKKDFPEMEKIPLLNAIDVERSYPGKIFPKIL